MNLQKLAFYAMDLGYYANRGEAFKSQILSVANDIAAECGIGEKVLLNIAPPEGPPSWYTIPSGALSHNPETGRLKYNPMIANQAQGWKPGTRPNWFDAVSHMYNQLIAGEVIVDCIDPIEKGVGASVVGTVWERPEWSPAQWVQIANRVLELASQVYSAEQIAAARKRIPS